MALQRSSIALLLVTAAVAAGQIVPEAAPIIDYNATAAPAPTPASINIPLIRNVTCSFVYTSPRFYRVEAEVTLQGVRTDENLLNDAFIRMLRSQLGLNACQLAMSQGTNCTSGTQQLPDEFQTIGVGAGQMNRVDSVRIAATRAERFSLDASRAALASDAFFPFRDNVDEAAALGVKAIIQPGGSLRDEESIAAADEHGIAMAFTGTRHFRH